MWHSEYYYWGSLELRIRLDGIFPSLGLDFFLAAAIRRPETLELEEMRGSRSVPEELRPCRSGAGRVLVGLLSNSVSPPATVVAGAVPFGCGGRGMLLDLDLSRMSDEDALVVDP